MAPAHKVESKDDDDILRVASYHRRDFDLAVIRINPRELEQIRNSLLRVDRPASTNLGDLDVLPLEILHEIFSSLDIMSLFKFRQINRQAQQLVCTVYGYRTIITHALGVFGAILKTRMASWFTIHDLLEVLYTGDCLLCGSFGGFVFLPYLSRCCLPCVETASQFRLISVTDAKKYFQLNLTNLRNSIPILRTIPGIYSMDETPRKRSVQILAEKQIYPAIKRCNAEERTAPLAQPNKKSMIFRYMATTTLPYINKASGAIEHGICCTGCQIAIEKDLRSTSREWDTACALRDRIYSRRGFLDHFKHCRRAQSLWDASNKGTISVSVPASVIRGGYFRERIDTV
ncbi:hypothetical protein AARAC_008065 [Aspergillus arachidicola]|uniref:F-box domain-containing protein n=1 Tax=Aspergillus arachidicola TaxID=656916 RepID=A0A2G7FEM2_9EURO|nr:hypothetical protein AARAC_008065 [Aspergillus arachidicola]